MYVYAHNLLINVTAAHVGGNPSSLHGCSICFSSLNIAAAVCVVLVLFSFGLWLNSPVGLRWTEEQPCHGEWIAKKIIT